MVMAQDPVPKHPLPLHPTKIEPESGVACRMMTLPGVKVSVQSAPQEMPPGVLVTVPEPVLVTVSVAPVASEAATSSKVAITDRF